MADQCTMAQLLQAPTEGYEDAIVVPAITTDNFELKHGLLTLHFDESFSEAWGRFKDLLRACPHHGFSELHQLDTFYNALNSKDQDSLNSVVGGNFLDKMPRKCLAIIESKSKVCYSCNKPVVAKDMVKALLLDKKSQNQAPATVKAVKESCVTCGGAHSYRNCPATDGNFYRDNIQEFISQASAVNYNQGNTSYRHPMMSNQIRPPGFPPVLNNNNVQQNQRNNQNRFNQNQNRGNNFNHGPVYQPLIFQPPAYQAPTYQASAPQTQGVSKEDFLAYVKANDAVMRNMKTQGQNMQNQLTSLTDLLTKFMNFSSASTLSSGTFPSNTIANSRSDLKSITTRSGVSYNGPQIPAPPFFFLRWWKMTKGDKGHALMGNKEKLSEMARTPLNEHCSAVLLKKLPEKLGDPGKFMIPYFDADPRVPLILGRSFLKTGRALIDVFEEVLGFSDMIASGNPTPYYDLIVSTTFPTLTPFGNSDFLLKEVDAFLALEDDPTSPKVDQSYLDTKGVILLLEAFLNNDPSLPPQNQGNYLPEVFKELKIYEEKSNKSSIDEPPEVELKDLPPHLEYAFLEGDDKLPVIIAKDLKEDFEPAVQHQRRVNPKIHDVIKQEVLKLLDAGLIYSISGSPWVSPVHCIHKKGGFTVVENEENELILTRLVTGWCICIDYQGINVEKSKVYVIMKLPHPTTVKVIRSFLGHAGFYRMFIKDFSKIARLMTRLLKKDTTFIFAKECVEAFQTLKRKLTEAPILIAPDCDMPFELMCDASDFAIGAVLGQRQEKHFRPIHYASKTMTEAKSNYTTTEKEMLAVVYAFEKFWSYLIMNKSIVYTDYSALKCLFAKKDSRARLLSVYTARKPLTFSRLATMDPPGDTMAQVTQPRSDRGMHFCNNQFAKVMLKFGVTHHLATLYHPQRSGQVEVLNRGLKRILERFIGENHASWSDKLDDALWAFRTAYKTPIGCTPYKLVYGKACHLPIVLEHKAYWALNHANIYLKTAGDHRKVQLDELHDQAYENSLIYKEKTKRLHDSKIKDRVFNIDDRVFLFNSRRKIFFAN
nr:hypothetical protein [Tanacetum cinerariifolium]